MKNPIFYCLFVFFLFLLFLTFSLALAQPPGGARQRGQGGGPPGGGQFQGGQGRPGGPGGQPGQFGQGRQGGFPGGQFVPGQRPGGRPAPPAENAEVEQEPELVTGPGTVPEIWDENPQEEFDVHPLADRAVISRPIPAKILRYAEYLISEYDRNGNGRLEFEEWSGIKKNGEEDDGEENDGEEKKKMSGSPQIIDLNGDGIITLDELVTHIEKFSRGRTIHNPYPLQQLIDNRVIPEQKRPEGIFLPISHPTPARNNYETKILTDRPPLSDDELAEEVQKPEESENETGTSTEGDESTPFQGRMSPGQTRRYAAPTVGLPAWFVQRDLNGDGQVSLYEFCAPNFHNEDLARFGRLDHNGDGFITPIELPQAKAE